MFLSISIALFQFFALFHFLPPPILRRVQAIYPNLQGWADSSLLIFCLCVCMSLVLFFLFPVCHNPCQSSFLSILAPLFSVLPCLGNAFLAWMNKATLQLTALLQAEDYFGLVLSYLPRSL